MDLLEQMNAVQPIINVAKGELGTAIITHPFHTQDAHPPSLSSLRNADAAHIHGHCISSKNYALVAPLEVANTDCDISDEPTTCWGMECMPDGVIDLILSLENARSLFSVEFLLLNAIQFAVRHRDLPRLQAAVKACKLGPWAVPVSESTSACACVDKILECAMNGIYPAKLAFQACNWLGVYKPEMAPFVTRTLADASSSAFRTSLSHQPDHDPIALSNQELLLQSNFILDDCIIMLSLHSTFFYFIMSTTIVLM